MALLMAMVVVDDSWTHSPSHMAWSEGRRPLGAVLHSSNEPSELSQWPCGHNDSTVNIVLDIIIIIIVSCAGSGSVLARRPTCYHARARIKHSGPLPDPAETLSWSEVHVQPVGGDVSTADDQDEGTEHARRGARQDTARR